MPRTNDTWQNSLIAAIEAINNLTAQDLGEHFEGGQHTALIAHNEIDVAAISRKSGIFYRHLVPWRKNLVSALANSYRRYFKLALAHQHVIEGAPDQWAGQAIQPAISITLGQLRDWYILACDGENQYVQKVGSVPFTPGQTVSVPIPLTPPPTPPPGSWRAPAWLFQVSPTLGILLLRTEHVPANDTEEKLGAAHTRLLLKAGRRVFLWELGTAIDTVRNEEIAAAGAIPLQIGDTKPSELTESKKARHWLKGTEGLTRKADLSKWKRGLTDKQELAFSLKYEYGLGLTEIAWRMGVDRKTASEHIQAAARKIDQVRSSEKRKANRAKTTSDF